MENDGHQFEDADNEYLQYQRNRIGFLSNPESDPEDAVEDEEEEGEGAPPPEVEKALYTLLHARYGSKLDKWPHVVVTLTVGIGGAALLLVSSAPIVNAVGVLVVFSALLKMLRGY